MGGSGIKIVTVILGRMDVMIYSAANNHKWDSCSG